MNAYRIVYLDAFTSEPFNGNPCAVVPGASGLTDDQMLKVARETNLSETAFLLPSECAHVRVRYFMPHKEIAFAGHPTIAVAFLLALEGRVPATAAVCRVDFEFNIGVLPVEIHWNADAKPVRAVMTQNAPEFGPCADGRDVCRCIGLRTGDLIASLPAQVVDTGVPFLLVPLGGGDGLRKARMNRSRLRDLLSEFRVDAAYLFCPGGIDDGADLHGRLFSPAGGSEDPFTGAAAGAAGAFAVYHGLLGGPELTVAQGHLVGRPGKAVVEITAGDGCISSVKVGGPAVKTLDGVIYVNNDPGGKNADAPPKRPAMTGCR